MGVLFIFYQPLKPAQKAGAMPLQVSRKASDLNETRCLRRQLEQEIAWLQRQQDALVEPEAENQKFLWRTLNGMIFSRRALLGRMPR